MRSFDPLLWRMHAEAGVTTHTIARRARESGLYFPPDPGAPEQSQLGGTIATNAGGPHAFKYGVTGDWVTGPGAGARAGRARARRRVRAQGRRGLRPARAAVRLGGHARDRHRGVAATDPAPAGAASGARHVPIDRGRVRGDPARARQRDRRGGARVRRRGGGRAGRACAASRRLGGGRLRSRSWPRPTDPRPRHGASGASSSRRCRTARRRSTRRRTPRDPRALALAQRDLARRLRRARCEALRGHRGPARSPPGGDRGDPRDRRAPRPRGLLVGARGRRQPACDVPARARRRVAAGARGRGRGRAVRARAAPRRDRHRRARDRRAQGRSAVAAVGAGSPSLRSGRSRRRWIQRGC